MSIQRAEELKRKWTDRYVQVRSGFPELKRFAGHTGQVKTVNMNCRLLVEFDLPADISWYDIDPSCVEEVAAPSASTGSTAAVQGSDQASTSPAASAAAKPAMSSAAAASSAASATPAAGNPLDLIRQQAAGKPASKGNAAPPATGSPLDRIRAQNAGQTAPAAAPAPKVAKAAPSASSSPAGSPLDQIRAQSGGSAAQAAPSPAPPAKTEPEPATSPTIAVPAEPVSSQPADDSFRPGKLPALVETAAAAAEGETLATLDQIRRQASVSSAPPNAYEQFRKQAMNSEEAGS
ncbi:MAG: hypothetical protein Fues2KO_43050 [Fuerstiella sp.]